MGGSSAGWSSLLTVPRSHQVGNGSPDVGKLGSARKLGSSGRGGGGDRGEVRSASADGCKESWASADGGGGCSAVRGEMGSDRVDGGWVRAVDDATDTDVAGAEMLAELVDEVVGDGCCC